ncbi:hypothetical protein D3C81_1666110 [compost metagenome]
MRGLPALLEAEGAMGKPLPVDDLERVFAGELDRGALLLAVSAGIDALGYQGACLVAQRAGFEQRYLRVGAERHPLGLLEPVVAEMPGLASGRCNSEGEAQRVGEGVVLAGGFGASDG